MKNSKIIVAFHIGRGGRHNNPGHVTYLGEKKIGEFTDDLFTSYPNQDAVIEKFETENLDTESDFLLDLFTDENLVKLAEYGITESDLGELTYYDCTGNGVGLTQTDVDSGVGTIDEDGHYDTTTTCFIEDCDEENIKLIINCQNYKSPELKEYLAENWTELINEEY